MGEACLRINSSRESYDNAQHYCKNLGGNIASLLTDKQVNFVLEELQKYQLQDKVGAKTMAEIPLQQMCFGAITYELEVGHRDITLGGHNTRIHII